MSPKAFHHHRYGHQYLSILKIVLPIVTILISAFLDRSMSPEEREKWEDPDLAGRGLSDYEKNLLAMNINPSGNYCDKEQMMWWDN